MTNCPNLIAKYNYMHAKEKNIKLNNTNKSDWYSDGDIIKTMASADLRNALRHATEAGLSQEEIRNIVNEYFGQRRLNS